MKVEVTYRATVKLDINEYPLVIKTIESGRDFWSEDRKVYEEVDALCNEVQRRMLIEKGIEHECIESISYKDGVIGEWW